MQSGTRPIIGRDMLNFYPILQAEVRQDAGQDILLVWCKRKWSEVMSATGASDTDVKIFLNLANPDVANASSNNAQHSVELGHGDPVGVVGKAHAAIGGGRGRDDDDNDDEDDDGEDDDEGDDDEREDDDGEDDDEGEDDEEEDDEEEDGEEEDDDAESRDGDMSGEESAMEDDDFGSKAKYARQSSFAELPALSTHMVPVMSKEDEMIEKQSALLELERLKAQGVTLTKAYTMDDDLTLIQWEIRRHLLLIEETNSISFMKDAMRLAFSGIEALNSKAGPVLELDGWSASASQELATHKFDPALAKLYKKYWRRGSSSPEMELTMGLLGSLGAYHFKKKFMQRSTPQRKTNVAHTIDDSDDEDVPNIGI